MGLTFMPNKIHPDKTRATYSEFSDSSTILKMVAVQSQRSFSAVLVEAIHYFTEEYATGEVSPCRLGKVIEHKNKIRHSFSIWKSDVERLKKMANIERVSVNEIIRRATNLFCARLIQRGTDNKAA